MSRYIDADDVLELLNLMYDNQEDKDDPYNVGVMGAINYIKHKAPTIDIVRCKECRWGKPYSEKQLECDALGLGGLKFPDDFCSYGCRDSEKPNNCEHITEDGVTCARYPACDDCPDNPLNKVKGSERLVKGSERSSK